MTTLTWSVDNQACTITLPANDVAWLCEQLRIKYPNVKIEVKS